MGEVKSEIEILKKILSKLDENFKQIRKVCDANNQGIIYLKRSAEELFSFKEDITSELVSLNEAVDVQKLQIDDDSSKFSTYVTVVNNLEENVRIIQKALFPNLSPSPRPNVNGYQSAMSLPTPPNSRRKKAPP